LQVQKTLPTADHQAVQAFQLDAPSQYTRVVSRQETAIQLQVVDTSTLLTQTLSQQLPTALAAQDQHPCIRPCDSLAQRRQLKQGLAVVAGLGIVNVEAVVSQYLRGGRTDAEPRQLRRGVIQLLHGKPRGRFAHYDHRTIAAKIAEDGLLFGGNG
jgi:hypothetical protein